MSEATDTKTYAVLFRRHNPQLRDGGYDTTRYIQAVDEDDAMRQVNGIINRVVYGQMEFLSMQEVQF